MPSGIVNFTDYQAAQSPGSRTLTHRQYCISQICVLLEELRDDTPTKDESFRFDWLQRIARLGRDSPDAQSLYIALSTGDLSSLTKTYREQGEERGLDRQAIEQRHKAALEAMRVHFPELRSACLELARYFRPPRGHSTRPVKH